MRKLIATNLFLIFCLASVAHAGGTPVTVNIGSHCIETRYGSAENCNANDVSDCESRLASNSCGFEDLNIPPGQVFKFTNAYCTDTGPLANPWETICQGYFTEGSYPACPFPLNSDESGYVILDASTLSGCKTACFALSAGSENDMWVAAGICEQDNKIQCQCNHLNNHVPPYARGEIKMKRIQ